MSKRFRRASWTDVHSCPTDNQLSGSRVGGSVSTKPATEIITLPGSVLPDANASGQASASAVVVDRRGQVHAGPLIRGHNPVAVTFELLIIEEDEHQ